MMVGGGQGPIMLLPGSSHVGIGEDGPEGVHPFPYEFTVGSNRE